MTDGILNFALLLLWLHQLIEQIDDPRQPSNGTGFRLKDGARYVFSLSQATL